MRTLFFPPSITSIQNDQRICYIKNIVCVNKTQRRIEFQSSIWMIFIFLCLVYGIVTISFYIGDRYLGYAFNIERYFSISFMSGLIGFAAVVFNIRAFKYIFIGLAPLIFIFYLPLVFLSYDRSLLPLAIFNHIPHFILIILLLYQKEPIPMSATLISSLFWIGYCTFLWIVFPHIVQLEYFGYWAMLGLILASNGIMAIGLYVMQKSQKKKAYSSRRSRV